MSTKFKDKIANVDFVQNVVPGAEGLYTTRNMIYGTYIKKCLIEYHRRPRSAEASPRGDRDDMGVIDEVGSEKEQTKPHSQAQIAPIVGDDVNYAINEPGEQDDEDSMPYDTAFHNDKKHLK